MNTSNTTTTNEAVTAYFAKAANKKAFNITGIRRMNTKVSNAHVQIFKNTVNLSGLVYEAKVAFDSAEAKADRKEQGLKLNAQDLADALGMSKGWMYKLCRVGDVATNDPQRIEAFEALCENGEYAWRIEELEKFLKGKESGVNAGGDAEGEGDDECLEDTPENKTDVVVSFVLKGDNGVNFTIEADEVGGKVEHIGNGLERYSKDEVLAALAQVAAMVEEIYQG